MKTKILKIILTTIAVLAVVVFIVWILGIGIQKNARVYCLKIQSQAVEFGATYSKWAKENPVAHSNDVEMCKALDVEIVVQ